MTLYSMVIPGHLASLVVPFDGSLDLERCAVLPELVDRVVLSFTWGIRASVR